MKKTKKTLRFAGRVAGFGIIAYAYGLCYEQGSKMGKDMEIINPEKIKVALGAASLRALALADQLGLVKDQGLLAAFGEPSDEGKI